MGLAYDLNTQPQPILGDWYSIIEQGSINLIQSTGPGNNGRSTGITFERDEFDVIIRDTTYIQDHYVIVGSYRAFFDNLNGGAGAYAWDGFVSIIRAHNLSLQNAQEYEAFTGPIPPTQPTFSDPSFYLNPGFINGFSVDQPYNKSQNLFFTYLCRMPYEVAPTLAGIASDSTVGIYGVDVGKRPQSTDFLFEVCIGGTQRIDSSEGALTGQSYTGYGAILIFQIFPASVVINEPAFEGGQGAIEPYTLIFDSGSSYQLSWKANEANHAGRYLPQPQFPSLLRDIEDTARSVFQTKNTGDSVLLTNLGNGYYITRIYDVAALNIFPLILDEYSYTATGEVAYDDGAGAVDFTTPFLGYWNYAYDGAGVPTNNLYCCVGDRDWGLDGDVAAYNLNGAYGSMILPSFNQVIRDEDGAIGGNDPNLAQIFIAVDNVTHGATTNAEIYASNFQYALNSVDFGPGGLSGLAADPKGVWPFAVKGGPFETQGGFTLPDRWTAKAVQQRTFTRDEETAAKNLDFYPPRYDPPVSETQGKEPSQAFLESVEDRDLKRLLENDPSLTGNPDPINFVAGLRAPNYQQPGLPNKTDGAFIGQPANIAYGFIGYTAGTGPIIFMYDFGTVNMSVPTTDGANVVYYTGNANPDRPLEAGVDILDVGDSMNDTIILDTGDTDRRCLSAQWDVDRDQWIYTFGLNGAGKSATVLSCNSAFDRQPPTQIAYLDQTDQFSNLDSEQRTCIYIPRNMTPFLDGFVLFGGEPDYTQPGRPGIPAIEVPNPVKTPDGEPPLPDVTGFQVFSISGTTGRTARVWTDYLLFDGVDSLVAVELQNLGLRVTVENVEWYKAKILRKGELGLTPEEIEDWVRSQQTEYRETLKLKERQGRLRTRRRQQAAWREGLEDTLSGDFYETTGFENLEQLDAAAETFVPDTRTAAPKSGNKSREHASIRKGRRDNKRNPE